jgi:hypothetical protein
MTGKVVAVRETEECRSCAFFQNRPDHIERALNGLTSLSSGLGSTRSDDGLCSRHECFRSASFCCSDFVGKAQVMN